MKQHILPCVVSLLMALPPAAFAEGRISAKERDILLDFYRDTHGEDWTSNDGWLGPEGTECRWFGITCACFVDPCSELFVGAIELPNNNVRGQLPRKLASLRRLILLDLKENRLRGPIPPELGSLRLLELLDLSFNQLEGPIPPELAGLKNLEWLDVSQNRLSGTLPNLGALRRLLLLGAADNFLSGELPSWLGALPRLVLLGLPRNNFTGAIPPEIFELQHLNGLDFADNRLSGRLPENIGHAPQLGGIALGGNRLSGAVPESITELQFLSGIDFSWNALFSPTPEVDAFVDERADVWPVTQTWAPEALAAVATSPSSVRLEWSLPANYLSTAIHEPGGYYVYLRSESQEKYRRVRTVHGKQTLALEITGLQRGTTYEFRLQTFSKPHQLNKNLVRSEFTPAVRVMTPLL